jgi:Tfp pilus assembly PilM family ATPase
MISILNKYPKLERFLEKTAKLLKSETVIGGISISNSAIRFIRINDGAIEKIGVILEPGVVSGGKLKNKEAFLKALLALRYKLGNPKEDIHVIVSLPPDNIYTQAFSLPIIEKHLIDEAAKLNLQLISPIDIKTVYMDWEKIGESQEEGGKLEFLGGFADKTIVNDFVAVFRDAGFGVTAVEFPALALTRLIREDSYNSNVDKPQVILSISSDGSEFIVIKNNHLYFNYFVSWGSVEGGSISLSAFSDIITQEMKRVLNFYSSHWNEQLTELILVTHGLYGEIEEIIKKNLPSLNVKPLVLSERYSNLNFSWYVALGCALRGRIPRSQDVFISLMDVGTEQSFFESRVTYFVKIWRTIILSVLGFLVFLFFMEGLFFLQISNNLSSQLSFITGGRENQEVTALEQSANEFNTLVTKALFAKQNSRKISKFFNIFNQIAGDDIKIQRILFDSDRASVLITAIATSEQSVINFKNNLSSHKEFRDVNFSFTSTTNNPDGTISFPITLGVNI